MRRGCWSPATPAAPTATGARAWKAELASARARRPGWRSPVCHFPPGTSKWNKIEHRLFCHITRTWRGRPLTSYEVVVNTIAATATSTGLTVTAVLDAGRYPTGAEVTDAQMTDLEDRVIARHGFHGDWNYTILAAPRPAPDPDPAPAPAPQPPARPRTWPPWTSPRSPACRPAAPPPWPPSWPNPRCAPHSGGRGPPAAPPARRRTTPGRRSPSPATSWPPSCHRRFALPARAIAALLGCHRSTIGHELPRTRQLLAATATAIPPGPVTLATYQDLRDYAATAGITLPGPALTRTPSPPR